MWHASASWHNPAGPVQIHRLTIQQILRLWNMTAQLLHGIGDVALGEWREQGRVALHQRRRLTEIEWGDKPWGMDYRNTPEGERRLEPCRPWLPKLYVE